MPSLEEISEPIHINLQVADVDHKSAFHDVWLEGRGLLQHSADFDLGHAALFHSHFGMARER
jgi:hypothetical protein